MPGIPAGIPGPLLLPVLVQLLLKVAAGQGSFARGLVSPGLTLAAWSLTDMWYNT